MSWLLSTVFGSQTIARLQSRCRLLRGRETHFSHSFMHRAPYLHLKTLTARMNLDGRFKANQ